MLFLFSFRQDSCTKGIVTKGIGTKCIGTKGIVTKGIGNKRYRQQKVPCNKRYRATKGIGNKRYWQQKILATKGIGLLKNFMLKSDTDGILSRVGRRGRGGPRRAAATEFIHAAIHTSLLIVFHFSIFLIHYS